jgi:hypothetical protein
VESLLISLPIDGYYVGPKNAVFWYVILKAVMHKKEAVVPIIMNSTLVRFHCITNFDVIS